MSCSLKLSKFALKPCQVLFYLFTLSSYLFFYPIKIDILVTFERKTTEHGLGMFMSAQKMWTVRAELKIMITPNQAPSQDS